MMTLKEVNKQLRVYPTPISGCDAQYTWLLEERTRLTGNPSKVIDRVVNIHSCAYDGGE